MSLLRETYYQLKPFLPHSLRLCMRRFHARRTRTRSYGLWPINEAAAKKPEGWPGWPGGKKFALLLTHDVEGQKGLKKCPELMQLESRLGFRSSFNFIPEGDYRTPQALREELVSNGFEVGVHDLYHNGKLYGSQKEFKAAATKINRYLKEWGAVGFRSGFMHHNLEWLHELDISYDMSTFDTDPFEPQPDPHPTIFPFWAEHPVRKHRYLEFPYTLPQDSTLFLILQERSIAIWKNKLDWIARNNGMALLDTHPDYMRFSGAPERCTYPVSFYEEFLEYVKSRYAGQYWACLPRELAEFMRMNGKHIQPQPSSARKKVWIDLDNTPHVPFFAPIIQELESRGHSVVVTSRQAFQVRELADKTGLKHTCIGRHYGKHSVAKVLGLFIRAVEFLPFVLREKPSLAVSHGARSQILISKLLGVETVLLADYEYAKILPFLRPGYLFVPQVIPLNGLKESAKRVYQYPGIKEDVYVPGFRPSSESLRQLSLDPNKLLVTVRPPATEAHYRSPESDVLFEAAMDHLTSRSDVQVVLLPRNQNQFVSIKNARPAWFSSGKTIVPQSAIDGLNLLWHSDAVVSGGGTMNREAAALGVPVYSIFRGKTGAVDLHLQKENRLLLLESPAEVRGKIVLRHRAKDANSTSLNSSSKALLFIVEQIEQILSPDARNHKSENH